MSNLHAELDAAVDTFRKEMDRLETEHGVQIDIWRSHTLLSKGEKATLRSEVKKSYEQELNEEAA